MIKTPLFLFLIFLTMQVLGQSDLSNIKTAVSNFSQLNDSLPQVIYRNDSAYQQNIAWFVNDQLVGEAVTKTLNTDQIASINVEKKGVIIDNISYKSKISITMKEGYQPKLISLNDLKAKYTNLKNSSVLFMFENEIVTSDYGQYIVDENFILQIIVDKVEIKTEKIDIYLIRLLTRSEENIRKAKEIRIR
jgi:hypothetical protein